MINEALNSSPPLQLTQFYARQLHQLHRQAFYPELLCMRATVCIFTMYTSLCIITSLCTSACTPLPTVVCTRTMQYAVRCSGLGAPPSCSVTPLLQKVNTQNWNTLLHLLVDYSLQNTLSNKYSKAVMQALWQLAHSPHHLLHNQMQLNALFANALFSCIHRQEQYSNI